MSERGFNPEGRSLIMEKIENEKKEERKKRLGGIVKKVAIGGAFIGAMTAGTVKYGQYVAQHDKKIMNDYGTELDKKLKEEEALHEAVKDPRVGYVDLEDYLKDYPEVREYKEKLEKARQYFEERRDR